MIYLRGNNVYPAALEAVIRRFADVAEYRVTIDRTGPLAEVRIEVEPGIAVSAKTVGELRKATSWPENAVISVPQEHYPEGERPHSLPTETVGSG